MKIAMRIWSKLTFFSAILVVASAARAELSKEDLAKIAQNPVGNLISVPMQENLNLNAGPYEKNLSVLNIQPVIPIHVSEDWNIITRRSTTSGRRTTVRRPPTTTACCSRSSITTSTAARI